MMLKGLEDALAGNAEELDHSVYMPKLQALAQERKQLAIEK